MRAESDGDDKSVSKKGAIGLMQIMPKTYAELQTKLGLGPDPFDPRANILAGAAYLAEMIEHYGETGFLAAYNAGPRRYEELLRRGRPLPVETTDYVARLAPELGFADNPAALIPAPFDAL
ncbi:MAG: lytic transglycosylase domain-containing protein, partial [Methylocystis sp.]